MTEIEDNRIGIIYKIEGAGLTYYGSTIQPLCERKSTHRTLYNKYIKSGKSNGLKCMSYDIFDKCNDWTITEIERIITNKQKNNLLERENYYIENNDCVNKIQAIQSKEDLKEYQRKWAEKNRREKGIQPKAEAWTEEKHREYQREWMANKRKNLNDETKEEILEKRRRNYNPEKAREYMNSLTDEQKQKRAEDQRIRRAKAKAKAKEEITPPL